MQRTLPVWAFLILLAGLTACGGASDGYAYGGAATPAMDPMPAGAGDWGQDTGTTGAEMMPQRERMNRDEPRMDLATAAPPPPPPAPGQAPAPQPPPGEVASIRAPMLIYSAQITMAVFEVTASLGKVEALARELGGFLSRRDDAAITIRVPAARFDEVVRRIEGIGDMLHRNVAAEDVTEEFLDLEVRIRNARAVRDRLEKLLDKATKVEESVQLERELGRVAGEIERFEGRLKYLRDRVSFSTITVSFRPRPTESIGKTTPRLPVDWLSQLGLRRLLQL